jgi:type IV secretion system protein VirB5
MLRTIAILVTGLLTLFVTPTAHAQWAVIDVAALQKLVIQVQQMQQAIQTAQNQLTQAQQEYQSITGPRGMESLLSGTVRNYLPGSWTQISTALAAPIQSAVNTNAVLTPQQMAGLSPAERQLIANSRGNAALLQVTAQQAYATASSRFASIQQLISAIPMAHDQKGVLDLQARIEAEQGMLQNDATKLNVLYQAAQAQEWAQRQSTREQVVADVGNLRTLPPLRLP